MHTPPQCCLPNKQTSRQTDRQEIIHISTESVVTKEKFLERASNTSTPTHTQRKAEIRIQSV